MLLYWYALYPSHLQWFLSSHDQKNLFAVSIHEYHHYWQLVHEQCLLRRECIKFRFEHHFYCSWKHLMIKLHGLAPSHRFCFTTSKFLSLLRVWRTFHEMKFIGQCCRLHFFGRSKPFDWLLLLSIHWSFLLGYTKQ